MTMTIRPYRQGQWIDRTDPAHDPRIVEIHEWPHAFDEHADRWSETRTSDGRRIRRERSDFAGCRKCGASELSAIHWRGTL